MISFPARQRNKQRAFSGAFRAKKRRGPYLLEVVRLNHIGVFEGSEQRVISKANRIISVCSGRWQEISLQLNETVSVIGLHLSSQGCESRGGRERGGGITDRTVMKIGWRIMSLVVSSSSRPLSLLRVTGWRGASQPAAY